MIQADLILQYASSYARYAAFRARRSSSDGLCCYYPHPDLLWDDVMFITDDLREALDWQAEAPHTRQIVDTQEKKIVAQAGALEEDDPPPGFVSHHTPEADEALRRLENAIACGTSPPENHKTEEDDWIAVRENGEPLWRFHRGDWGHYGKKITDVKIGDDGISLWIKVGKP